MEREEVVEGGEVMKRERGDGERGEVMEREGGDGERGR